MNTLLKGEAIRGSALQVAVLGYSLAAGAFHSNPPSLTVEPEGLARLAIAVAAGMGTLAIVSRVLRRFKRSPGTAVLDLLVAYGGVAVSQVILSRIWPSLLLPQWAPTQGGYVGAMLFVATRAMLAAFADRGDALPETGGYRMRYGIAASLALALGLAGLAGSSTQVRIAAILVSIGSAYLLLHVASARPNTIPRAAAWWYYGALFPASLVLLFGSKVYLYWVPLVILLFAEANQSAAASLSNRPPSRSFSAVTR